MDAAASVSDVHRPVVSLVARIAAIPFVVAVVVLLLSDRAPGATRDGLRKGVVIGRKVEDRTGIDVVNRSDLPFSWEQLGHAGLWAIAVVLAYAAVAYRASLRQTMLAVFTVSCAVELGQFFLTATRHLEWGDVASNGVGVALGGVLASIMATIGARRRRPGVAAA